MNRVIELLVALCGVVAFAVGCGGPKVYLAVDRPVVLPPEIAGLKMIAVMPIPCDENKAYGEMLTGQIESRLLEKFNLHPQHPELATRTDIDKVIAERNLPPRDWDSKDAAAGIASAVRADAVIFGRISVAIRETYRETGSPVPVVGGLLPPRQVVERSAVVTATLSMASVIAGRVGVIMRSKSILKRQGWLGTPEKTVEEAIRQCVMEFEESIVPPSLRAVYELQLAKTDDPEMKAGNNSAKFGNWQDAAVRYASAVNRDAKNHAACYNLGVAMMFLNRREEAEPSVKTALELKKDEDDYAWADSVRKEIKPDEALRTATQYEVNNAKDRKTLRTKKHPQGQAP